MASLPVNYNKILEFDKFSNISIDDELWQAGYLSSREKALKEQVIFSITSF